jgi:hypothetical protein
MYEKSHFVLARILYWLPEADLLNENLGLVAGMCVTKFTTIALN